MKIALAVLALLSLAGSARAVTKQQKTDVLEARAFYDTCVRVKPACPRKDILLGQLKKKCQNLYKEAKTFNKEDNELLETQCKGYYTSLTGVAEKAVEDAAKDEAKKKADRLIKGDAKKP
jgi:hypothetical protein